MSTSQPRRGEPERHLAEHGLGATDDTVAVARRNESEPTLALHERQTLRPHDPGTGPGPAGTPALPSTAHGHLRLRRPGAVHARRRRSAHGQSGRSAHRPPGIGPSWCGSPPSGTASGSSTPRSRGGWCPIDADLVIAIELPVVLRRAIRTRWCGSSTSTGSRTTAPAASGRTSASTTSALELQRLLVGVGHPRARGARRLFTHLRRGRRPARSVQRARRRAAVPPAAALRPTAPRPVRRRRLLPVATRGQQATRAARRRAGRSLRPTCARRTSPGTGQLADELAASADRQRRDRSSRPARLRRATTSSSAAIAAALAVVYAPYDEDYGYVTLQAFRGRQAGDHRRPTPAECSSGSRTASTASSPSRPRGQSEQRSIASPRTTC